MRLSVGAPITGENPYAKTAWRQAPEHVGAYFGDAGPNLCGNQPVRRVHRKFFTKSFLGDERGRAGSVER